MFVHQSYDKLLDNESIHAFQHQKIVVSLQLIFNCNLWQILSPMTIMLYLIKRESVREIAFIIAQK